MDAEKCFFSAGAQIAPKSVVGRKKKQQQKTEKKNFNN
jgi:hypothetical protein